jgi:hypothetical protein
MYRLNSVSLANDRGLGRSRRQSETAKLVGVLTWYSEIAFGTKLFGTPPC